MLKKKSYIGHKKFLPCTHVYKNWRKVFKNSLEFEFTPKPLAGIQILARVSKLQFRLGKAIKITNKKRMKKMQ